ncbi:MAG: DNA polymerase III subunit beta [Alphaproteobacteria bacterium]|nr:DNA polymerase III subunit beta [Alphaproteobacteria bacterium]
MDLRIERQSLMRSLSHVQSVVERRNTIPILSNVLIECGDGAVTLTATDMDLTLTETTGASVLTSGAVTAPAHMLFDIVRKLPDGVEVRLTKSDGSDRMTLTAGKARFELSTLPREDYPALDGVDLPISFEMPAEELKTLIERTRFAISTEETRYYLNGIYLHAMGEGASAVLRAVATDGHRLARFETVLPTGAADMPGVIIPRKTVGELVKLLDDSDESVRIALSDSRIEFRFSDVTLSSKLIDGTFPDYERVIPTQNDKPMTVDKASFAQAVDRVSTIASAESRAVKLSATSGRLNLSANSPDRGQASEDIDVDYGATDIEIGFNARYLLDIATQLSGETAEFVFADAGSPTLVKDRDNAAVLYVLMPMRV